MSGVRGFVRDNGLSLAFGALFLGALVFQAISGHDAFNEDQRNHMGEQISLGRYVVSAQFGVAVLENWQSEFLAVASMAIFAVYLRQRGSPESKPVGAPHDATGIEG